jgi:hypothetical protein
MQLGFSVLPATEEGVIIAATLFDSEAPQMPVATERRRGFLPKRGRLFGFFSVGSWQWVDNVAPSEEAIQDLISRLRSGLSPLAFKWLTALAVYPSIAWFLTLFLGSRLVDTRDEDAGLRSALLELARLPWLQFCHMPQWLRERLIEQMTPEQAGRVRTALEELLLTAGTGAPKNVALEMGTEVDQAAPAPGHDLRRSGRQSDPILIDFMTRKASRGDFPLRSRVAMALGLDTSGSPLRDFFTRTDLGAMRAALSEVADFKAANPPKTICTGAPERAGLGPDVLKVTDWFTISDEPVIPPRKLYLVKRDPRTNYRILVDEFSLALWERRKGLILRLGLAGAGVLSVALAVFYQPFFNAVGTFGAGVLTVGAIVYTPLAVFWLFFVRPFASTLKRFPTVPEVILDHSNRHRRR